LRDRTRESLYNQDECIDYEQVQNTVNGINAGTHRVEPLTRAGEECRLVGNNQLLVGASLIVGGRSRTNAKSDPRTRRNQEEELLEDSAKRFRERKAAS